MTTDHELDPWADDDRIVDAIRNEFLRPPPPDVERRHLLHLEVALADSTGGDGTRRVRPMLAAAAAGVVLGAASWLTLAPGPGTRLQTADDPSTAMSADATEPTGSTAPTGPADRGDDAIDTDATSTSIDLAPPPSDTSPGVGPSSTSISTSGTGSSSTSVGTPTTGPVATVTSGTADTGNTTSSENTTTTAGPTSIASSTSPSTSTPSTVRTGGSTQERLEVAWLAMNDCLLPRGFLFVGFTGVSDHPDASLPGYQAAVEDCDRTSGVGIVMDGIEVWGRTLTPGERDDHNLAAGQVATCMTGRGWDMALGPTPEGVLTITRFPVVPAQRRLLLGLDLASCGWLDLDLP